LKKDVIIAGLLGSVVMFVWLTLTNAFIPLKSDMIHNIPPNQLEIFKVLKENITDTGTYTCPYLSPPGEGQLPDYRSPPVFSITYSGITHGNPGSAPMWLPFLIILVVPAIAAWMLSVASGTIKGSYLKRMLFVASIGVIVALYDDVLQMSFGPQPKDYLLFLAVNNVITWILAGAVIAAKIKPAGG